MSMLVLPVVALLEIIGCFAVWAWWRGHAGAGWLPVGLLALACFATLLAMVPSAQAGRAFAAYGGVYIVASLGWMWMVEGARPDLWDAAGAALCLTGAAIILLAPR